MPKLLPDQSEIDVCRYEVAGDRVLPLQIGVCLTFSAYGNGLADNRRGGDEPCGQSLSKPGLRLKLG